MNYSIYLTALLTLITAGCSTTPGIKGQIMGANIEIAKQRAATAAKPILDAEIPTPQGLMKIVVYAPQGPNNGQVSMPDDPWARVADRGMGVLGTGLGIFLGGQAAVGLVEAAGAGIVGALRSMPDPVIVQPAQTVVVTQPSPIIVNQPAPLVVEQPEPIIVNPEIVNPVVVQPVIVQAP